MESALQDQKTIALNLIDEAMLLSDPSEPPTFQIFLSGSGLPIPEDGFLKASLMSSFTRWRILRSFSCQ
jgi:hypothetical protein